MALTTPNDRTLLNVIVAYERELMGPNLPRMSSPASPSP